MAEWTDKNPPESSSAKPRSRRGGLIGVVVVVYAIIILALMWWWDSEPAHFDVAAAAREHAGTSSATLPIGYTTTVSAVKSIQTLLDKPGGYISNQKLPPGLFPDNQPN